MTDAQKLKTLRAFVDSFASAAEAALNHADRLRSGMQVPFYGDFANVGPSTLRELRWWARLALATLDVAADMESA